MMHNAIEIENVSKHFKEFSLQNISFSLPTGYIMGFVGKNGSGKTTTIKLLLDLLQKDAGTIKLLEQKTSINLHTKEDIAVVFDDTFFVEDWKIKDVESAISPFYKQWNSQTFHDLLAQFDLSIHKQVKELSKGMKMKLMLAVALSHEAKLLILDEPTSGIDPVGRDELLDILLHYIEDEQHSVLFSTHITSDLDRIADYITIIDDGLIFYTGSKDALFEKYCIVKGELSELTQVVSPYFIGVQKSSIGFSALMDVKNMKYLDHHLVSEDVSMDEILVHIAQKKEVV